MKTAVGRVLSPCANCRCRQLEPTHILQPVVGFSLHVIAHIHKCCWWLDALQDTSC